MTTDFYDNFDDSTSAMVTDDPGICKLDPDPAETVVQTYVHSAICAFGLIGNMLVLVTYTGYKRSKSMTDVFLVNVAVSDLLFAAALPFIVYNERHDWSMGSGVCMALQGAYSINLYAGMLLLACVSGDRYVAIVQARHSYGAHSKILVYSRLICATVWVGAVALSIPTIIYTKRMEEINPLSQTVSVSCQLSFSHHETAKLMKVLVPSLQVSIGFLLPLLVMVFCYSSIICTLLSARSSHRHKAVRVVLAVVAVFVVCQLPYNAALMTHTLSLFKERGCTAERAKLKVLAVTKSVAYLHCCLNPVIYAFVGVKFRGHFQKILQDIWCLSKRYIYSGRSSNATSDLYISGRRPTTGSNNENDSSFTA